MIPIRFEAEIGSADMLETFEKKTTQLDCFHFTSEALTLEMYNYKKDNIILNIYKNNNMAISIKTIVNSTNFVYTLPKHQMGLAST